MLFPHVGLSCVLYCDSISFLLGSWGRAVGPVKDRAAVNIWFILLRCPCEVDGAWNSRNKVSMSQIASQLSLNSDWCRFPSNIYGCVGSQTFFFIFIFIMFWLVYLWRVQVFFDLLRNMFLSNSFQNASFWCANTDTWLLLAVATWMYLPLTVLCGELGRQPFTCELVTCVSPRVFPVSVIKWALNV